MNMYKAKRLAVSAVVLLLMLQLGCVVREVVVTPTPGPGDTPDPVPPQLPCRKSRLKNPQDLRNQVPRKRNEFISLELPRT